MNTNVNKQIEKVLINNADLLEKPMGKYTRNVQNIWKVLFGLVALPFWPLIGLGVGVFSGRIESVWRAIGFGFVGLVCGIVAIPVCAVALVAATIKSVVSIPLALAIDLPNQRKSSTYKLEVELYENLKMLEKFHKDLNDGHKINEYRTKKLLEEINSINRQLSRPVVETNEGESLSFEPKIPSLKTYEEVQTTNQTENIKEM